MAYVQLTLTEIQMIRDWYEIADIEGQVREKDRVLYDRLSELLTDTPNNEN